MNDVVKEIVGYITHSGVSILDGAPGRGSGRYPLGSGENPHQHGSDDFLSRVQKLRDQNFNFTDPETGKRYSGDTAIAKSLGLSTTQFRVELQYANHMRKQQLREQARALLDKGYSRTEVAKELGFNNESSIRSLLNENSESRMLAAQKTAAFLKEKIDEHGMVDVGVGIERSLGVSKEKLKEALYILEKDGYKVYTGGIPTGDGKQTTLKAICTPETKHKDIYNYDKVYNIAADYSSHDGGDTFDPKFVYPASMDPSRIKINYAETGGKDKDGLIEIRRGVDDLSLGESHYAQVRILVDGTHYLKGMAVYSDNMPEGVDLIFNTNKSKGTPMLGEDKNNTVLKKISSDPDNPFGSLIKEGVIDPANPIKNEGGQSYYYDEKGKKHLSLINKRAEEGDWGAWADKLPSQFLAKQNRKLIKDQLELTYADKVKEFEEYDQLTNPTIKKSLLNAFADDCDTSAVHLKAVALPRQKYQVIIPITSMKDNEIYAPNYRDGETVALVRFPHGGTFEIPILKVNNKNSEGVKVITKNAKDAVGINSKVAERLSGADFDGDTVMVIPCNSSNSKVHITSRELTGPLKELKDFDPKIEYSTVGKPKGTYKVMHNTQNEMGKITNLIADMTIKGAPDSEIVKAVKHSMVVIDAEKHLLDYKQSEIDNDIKRLKKKYQEHVSADGKVSYGASTLLTRAKNEVSVPKKQGQRHVNKDGSTYYTLAKDLYYEVKKKTPLKDEKGRVLRDEKGAPIYEKVPGTNKIKYTPTGKVKMRTQQSTQMAEAKDAYELSSGTLVENMYADYANKMKSLAKKSRKTALETGDVKYSPTANKVYSKEAQHLKAEVQKAQSNAPLERRAQAIANSVVNAKKADNPDMTKAEISKQKQLALTQARAKVGAQRHSIEITDKEWEAIQAGAVSKTTLEQIIRFADMDKLKERATPRSKNGLSDVQIARIRSLAARGYTNEQIAKAVGVSASTVSKNL